MSERARARERLINSKLDKKQYYNGDLYLWFNAGPGREMESSEDTTGLHKVEREFKKSTVEGSACLPEINSPQLDLVVT